MKPSTKRLVSFTAAFVMIIATLVMFFNLIQPAYRESQEIKGQILSKETSLKNEQGAATQVENLLEQYRGNQSPQEAVSNALPLTNDQSEIIHQIQTLAVLRQMAVQSLSVGQPGAKPAQSGSGSAPRNSSTSLVRPIGVVSIQLRVSGTYTNFKAFLASLETNIRVTDVSSVVIAPVGKPNQDFYNFDLTLSTYYQSS